MLTSGVLLFARNADSHRRANQWFQDHQVKKAYDCLAAGEAPAPTFKINDPIGGAASVTQIEVKDARVREMFFLNRLKAEFSRGPDGRMTNEKLTVRYGRFANMRDGHGRVSLRRRPPIET